MPAFALLIPPGFLAVPLRRLTERSPTTHIKYSMQVRRFGEQLEPRYIFGALQLDQ